MWDTLSLEGGVGTPIKQMQRYLSLGVAGEVNRCGRKRLTSPAAPVSKVALHFFDGRIDPSFEEGIVPFLVLFTGV